MIEISGRQFDLKYSIKRVEMIENNLGKGIVSSMVHSGGMLSVSELRNCLTFGLVDENGHYLAPKTAMDYTDALFEQNSYASLCAVVLEAVQRDCPFFFQEN